MQKALVTALLLLSGICGANAEVWRVREGQCGEWRSRWNVEQDGNGVWAGSIDHEHVGGACVQGTGTRARSNVRASIAGENFFATREVGGQFCSYFGQIQQDRVRGVELCEGLPTRMAFGLRFPRSAADPSQPQQPPTASGPTPAPEQDEVSEGPEQGTTEPPGSVFEFRRGPGRQ